MDKIFFKSDQMGTEFSFCENKMKRYYANGIIFYSAAVFEN